MKIAPKLTLPDDAVTQTYAYIGRKGSGKTYAAGKFAELLLAADVQVVVLDPVGNWYGLRLDKTGRKPSDLKIPILGGEHGDVPLEPTAGKIVADFIVSTGSSAVLDVSTFRKDGRKTFVTAFAEELFHRKKSDRTPMHFIIEESQVFAPQFSKGQERMLGAIEDIVRLGRNYGIGCSMITQRPQSVNKEVLNQAEPLIVFQLVGAHERKAVADWVKHAGADVELDALPSLDVGECLFWSPAWLRTFVRTKFYPKRTFDASATPKLGETLPKPQKLKPVDLDSLKVTMADTIAKAKADDPRELHKTIAELQRQLKSNKPVIDQQAIDRAVASAVAERDKYLLALIDERDGKLAEGCERFDKIKTLCDLNGQVKLTKVDPPALPNIGPVGLHGKTVLATHKPRVATDLPARSDSSKTDGQTLPRGERSILTVCAQYRDGAERDQITILTGYKRSTRDAYLQRLREKGLIETPPGEPIVATQDGLDALGDSYEVLPTGHALIEHWLDRLPVGERVILSSVVDAYPSAVDRRSISDATGYKRSTRDAYLQRLKSRRLVTIESDGVKAAGVFFEGVVS